MSLRYYANAPATTLASSVTALATTIDVASITGLPIQYPFVLILDRGTASEEVVLVTAGTGTTLTVERGYDSTTAFSHTSDSSVEHGFSAIDLREANTHVNATGNVHGVAGDVVGTTDTQVVTNKDLTDPTNTFPATLASASDLTAHEADTSAHGVAGDVVGTSDAQTLTNKDISRANNTISGFSASVIPITNASGQLASGGKTIPSGAVVGTSDSQTLTNKTLTSPTITSPTITGVGEVQRAIKTAFEQVNDTNQQNDDHLFFTLTPGTWLFDLALFVSSDNDDVGDFKCQFDFSGTSTDFMAGEIASYLGATGVSNTNLRVSTVTALNSGLASGLVGTQTQTLRVHGAITVTATGTFRFKWAQNTSPSATTVTVEKGSWMRAERVI